ncbi:heavy-metal-associated domain-containing protein [Amycolatopsis acidiphila]|uniref:Heavy-metal-associated domain-containing protein n=1 Tax=Amycolatopsis acidiphila TaxID=715473 RepID=A0A558ALZ6_9PSEU|nr:heavy-metal-associated domain-containing protein [Amycolatopsis acidiphila]TVT25285.1 heavy-metal-associated domain-containing protein [Amycolatopsis acidiphila]UIJ62407.1 heavy-metal-associated domain-containing protein [Amycolatopsis acidiphila]GHG83520.1 metal-binding protein [Amycolatopsis acidiphila]
MTRQTFAVSGMTCEHCAASVREELGELPGVRTVEVDLGRGSVRVASAGTLDAGQVEAAVRTAGYELVR